MICTIPINIVWIHMYLGNIFYTCSMHFAQDLFLFEYFSKMTSRCLFSYFTSTWYMYFYCDALYFIWEWQSIFMMYSMCLLYILCLRFAQWWNVLFSHCQKPTAKLAYYAFLSWANSIELFLISYKFHYMFSYSLWAQLIL